ncbi:MAG: Flp family type IVb pilin [Deltaproteobacteria bacterium]|nr:Flp family type IVb pilin [Deltaproteobacteria bacterium]
MKALSQKIKALVRDEEGATMVEYGLMLALIAVVSIAVVTTLGTNLRDNIFIPVRDAL